MSRLAAIAAAAATLLAGFAPQTALVMPDVDVELILMSDVSGSMDQHELAQQRRGYIDALRSPEVIAAIEQGAHGRIAVAYAEWAGPNDQRIVVDWTVIDGPGALVLADLLESTPTRSADKSATTAVAAALSFASAQIIGNRHVGERAVIDLSGDGVDAGSGAEMTRAARDAAVLSGITINGLPILGVSSDAYLEDWYRQNVIGGAGAFIVPVLGLGNFAEAVRRKLVLEIAGVVPETRVAALDLPPEPAPKSPMQEYE